MNIGNIIRMRRRELDLTQESLAEVLNVSVSAVSQWESGRTMPDLALIPAICSVLQISSDELLGIDLERKKEEIDRICTEAEKYHARGYLKDGQKILEDGLKRFPDSFKIMNMLAYVDYVLSYDDVPDEQEAARARAIDLSERILEKCADSEIRESAVQRLCLIYKVHGNPERAKELLGTMGSLNVCRQVMAPFVYSGNEALTASQKLILDLLNKLSSEMASNYELDFGERRYSAEENMRICEKVIAMYRLLFEDGDFGFFHTVLSDTERLLSEYYADKKDAENTLVHIRAAAYHAIEFVKHTRVKNFVQTSLVFRGYESYGSTFITSGRDNDALELKRWLRDGQYDFVRGTEEFGAILAELEEYAGEWEKRE